MCCSLPASVPDPMTGAPLDTPPSATSWLTRLRGTSARSRRVSVLLTAVLLISLADLDMTLAYATSGGMIEANPIARAVMSYGSSGVLAAWKLASVALCVGILFRTRARRSAEIATWVCFLMLVWLSFRWEKYNEQMPIFGSTVMVDAEAGNRLMLLDE
jgi:hypothetical protein